MTALPWLLLVPLGAGVGLTVWLVAALREPVLAAGRRDWLRQKTAAVRYRLRGRQRRRHAAELDRLRDDAEGDRRRLLERLGHASAEAAAWRESAERLVIENAALAAQLNALILDAASATLRAQQAEQAAKDVLPTLRSSPPVPGLHYLDSLAAQIILGDDGTRTVLVDSLVLTAADVDDQLRREAEFEAAMAAIGRPALPADGGEVVRRSGSGSPSEPHLPVLDGPEPGDGGKTAVCAAPSGLGAGGPEPGGGGETAAEPMRSGLGAGGEAGGGVAVTACLPAAETEVSPCPSTTPRQPWPCTTSTGQADAFGAVRRLPARTRSHPPNPSSPNSNGPTGTSGTRTSGPDGSTETARTGSPARVQVAQADDGHAQAGSVVPPALPAPETGHPGPSPDGGPQAGSRPEEPPEQGDGREPQDGPDAVLPAAAHPQQERR